MAPGLDIAAGRIPTEPQLSKELTIEMHGFE